MVRALLLTILLAAVGGCDPGSTPSGYDQPSQACAREPTAPLTAAELTRTLRANGFTVFPEPGVAICDVPATERMPISVTNVLFEGPHENIDAHEEIAAREGHVGCGLRRGPIWGWQLDEDLDAPPASPIFSGEKAVFSFANVECTLYPEGERREEQIRNLQRAMRDLFQMAREKRRA